MEIDNLKQHAMTVADLIAELENYSDETIVVFGHDGGDRCHTDQALPVSKVCEMETEQGYPGILKESYYSDSGVAIVERGNEPMCSDETDDCACVVLR